MSNPLATQREFFEILDEFFKEATGERPEKFAAVDKFGEAIHEKGKQFAPRAVKA